MGRDQRTSSTGPTRPPGARISSRADQPSTDPGTSGRLDVETVAYPDRHSGIGPDDLTEEVTQEPERSVVLSTADQATRQFTSARAAARKLPLPAGNPPATPVSRPREFPRPGAATPVSHRTARRADAEAGPGEPASASLASLATRLLPRPPLAYELARKLLHETNPSVVLHDIDLVEDREAFRDAWVATGGSAATHGNLSLVATATVLRDAAGTVAEGCLVECLVSTTTEAFEVWIDTERGRLVAAVARADLEVENL